MKKLSFIFMFCLLLVVIGAAGISPHYLKVEWDAVIQVYGTLFGVIIGGYLSGIYATETVRKEIDYNKSLVKANEIETKTKNELIIRANLIVLRRELKATIFHVESLIRGYNGFENNPQISLQESFAKINECINSLRQIDPGFITTDNLRLIYEIYTEFNEIENSYEGFLYDSDKPEVYLGDVKQLSQRLIDKINNNKNLLLPV